MSGKSAEIAFSPGGDPYPHSFVRWVHPSPQPQQHLDRFSRFCGINGSWASEGAYCNVVVVDGSHSVVVADRLTLTATPYDIKRQR